GPVAPGATLWSIAKDLRPDPAITTQQMVIALQRANPEAFAGGSINGLKVGARLRVPSLEEIRRIDPAEARAEVDRQLGR
ncbi:MAG: FimV/HubP family polar landmark protein, partial [Candidatus Competibacterales bacterium]